MTHPAVIAQALLVKSADDAHYQVGYSPVPVAMYNQAAAIQGDKLYMFGGYDANLGRYLSSLYEYDIATDTWTQKASYTQNYSANITFSTQTGKLHIIGMKTPSGASSNHITWDPLTNTYGTGGSTSPFGSTNISSGALFELSDPNLLYLDAGASSSPSGLQVYDLTAGTWTAKASSAIYTDGYSVVNGTYHKRGSNLSRKYDSITNTWTSLPSLPVTMYHCTGADYGGRFALLFRKPGGGQETSGASYIWDEATGSWLLGPKLPEEYGGGGARIAPKSSDGSVWLLGGHSNVTHDRVIRIFPKSVKDKAVENLQSFVHAS